MIKIENKMPKKADDKMLTQWEEYLAAIKKIKVGQSFLIKRISSMTKYRYAARMANDFLGITLCIHKEQYDHIRIYRIK